MKKRYVMTGGLVILCMVLFKTASFELAQSEYYKKSVTWELDEPLRQKEAEHRKDSDTVFWNEAKGTAEQGELGRSCEVSVITTYGRTDLLFPDSYLFDETDKAGCMIDRNTAYQLFGDTANKGKEIVYRNKTYEVRDILKSARGVLVVQADGENSGFDMVTVAAGAAKNSGYNFGGTLVRLELLEDIAELILFVIPYFLSCIWILAGLWRYRDHMWGRILLWAGTIVTIVIFMKLYSFPNYLIPPKWSDYQFWKETGRELLAAVGNLWRMEKRKPISIVFGYFYRSGILGVCVIALLVGIRKNVRKILQEREGKG